MPTELPIQRPPVTGFNRRSLAASALAPVQFECYPYPFKNSLVGIVTRATAATRERGGMFASIFPASNTR